MANEQYAFIEKSKVPTKEAWQEAICKCGFEFELDPDLKPFEDSGFSPSKLYGNEAGFEIDYCDSSELFEDEAERKALCGEKDYCISFRWGGSMIECASVLIASYALAKEFDAVVSYEGEEPSSLENFLIETQNCTLEAKKEF